MFMQNSCNAHDFSIHAHEEWIFIFLFPMTSLGYMILKHKISLTPLFTKWAWIANEVVKIIGMKSMKYWPKFANFISATRENLLCFLLEHIKMTCIYPRTTNIKWNMSKLLREKVIIACTHKNVVIYNTNNDDNNNKIFFVRGR